MNGDVQIRGYSDVARFVGRVEAWLLRREAEHNLLLGLFPRLRSGLASSGEGRRRCGASLRGRRAADHGGDAERRAVQDGEIRR